MLGSPHRLISAHPPKRLSSLIDPRWCNWPPQCSSAASPSSRSYNYFRPNQTQPRTPHRPILRWLCRCQRTSVTGCCPGPQVFDWTKDKPEHHGEFVSFPPMMTWPKPSQKPHRPIIVGGAFRLAARRAIRYGDGILPARRGTGSRGNRGGRLPERQARDGDALQHGFSGATVKLWRWSRGRAPPRPRRAHRPMGGDHATR